MRKQRQNDEINNIDNNGNNDDNVDDGIICIEEEDEQEEEDEKEIENKIRNIFIKAHTELSSHSTFKNGYHDNHNKISINEFPTVLSGIGAKYAGIVTKAAKATIDGIGENTYSKTIIYYQISHIDPNVIPSYIGSTTDFHKGMIEHKSQCNNKNSMQYNFPVYQYIRSHGGWDNWKTLKLEDYSYNTKIEKYNRKAYWIKTLNATLTRQKTGNFVKFEDLKAYHLNYKEKNRVRINERDKTKFQCACGGKYTYNGKSKHIKTELHQEWLKTQNVAKAANGNKFDIPVVEEHQKPIKNFAPLKNQRRNDDRINNNEDNHDDGIEDDIEEHDEQKEEVRTQNQYKIRNNTEYYAVKNSEKIDGNFQCACGGKYTHKTKLRHTKTKLHQEWLKTQNDDIVAKAANVTIDAIGENIEKYSKAVVTYYQISHIDPNVIPSYIGYTNDFHSRKLQHKKVCNKQNTKDYNYPVYQYIRSNGGWNNWQMLKIEDYSYNSYAKKEIYNRKLYWVERYNATLNKFKPGNFIKYGDMKIYKSNYKIENKEKIKISQSNYYAEKKVKLIKYNTDYRVKNSEKLKSKFQCACGGKYTHLHKAVHIKSKLHQDWLKTQNDENESTDA
eukprot:gene10879-14601_t